MRLPGWLAQEPTHFPIMTRLLFLSGADFSSLSGRPWEWIGFSQGGCLSVRICRLSFTEFYSRKLHHPLMPMKVSFLTTEVATFAHSRAGTSRQKEHGD